MADMNISKATASDMENAVEDYSVDAVNTDGVTDQDETTWQNTNWSTYLGYYKKIPELKKAIDAYATWAVGNGYEADDISTKVVLDHITGWGEDTFNSILWNMVVTKKISGDAFAEIVRDENGKLLNIKPLDPGSMMIIVDRKGIIKRYEQTSKIKGESNKKFKPEQILHLCNDRVADEIHGTSVVEACENIILTRNEAMADWKKALHRNVKPIIVFKLDTDDQTKINTFIGKMDSIVNKGENIYIPKDTVEFEILSVPVGATLNPIPWIEYNEDFFYKAVGVPAVVLGGSKEFSESSSKIVYLTFEQIWKKEQKDLEDDLWNQLQVRITINQPASLKNELLSDESKDAAQGMEFQQGDVTAGVAQ